MKAHHDANLTEAKIDLKENYDADVADGCSEDTAFHMIAAISGIRYFKFRSHQSKTTIADHIFYGMGIPLNKSIWKIAFRLRDQNTKKMSASVEYERHKKWAYNKFNNRVIEENDEIKIEKKIKKNLEDVQIAIVKQSAIEKQMSDANDLFKVDKEKKEKAMKD